MKSLKAIFLIVFVAGAISAFWTASVFAARPQPKRLNLGGGVPVLMYHHVGDLPSRPDRIRRDLTVSTADFEGQVKYLEAHGYHTITSLQLLKSFEGNVRLPEKPILLTFDDGYDDVFNNAVPILKKHNMVGTFAVITGYVGSPGYAPWKQILDARQQGMEIISHSFSHIDFSDIRHNHSKKVSEIELSIHDLWIHLGEKIPVFIYPYGHYNTETEQILKNNGFKLAFTTAFGKAKSGYNWVEMPRVRIHGGVSLQRFVTTVK